MTGEIHHDNRPCFFKLIFGGVNTDHLTSLKNSKEKTSREGKKIEEKDPPTQKMDSQLKFNEEKGAKRKVDTDNADLPFGENKFQTKSYSSTLQSHPIETERSKVWKLAESFTSDFPYFKSCMAKHHVEKGFLLRVPARFAKEHFPQGTAKIVLRNSEDKCWEVSYMSHGWNHVLSGGLKAFVLENKLKIGDICMFELLAKNEIRVHVFR